MSVFLNTSLNNLSTTFLVCMNKLECKSQSIWKAHSHFHTLVSHSLSLSHYQTGGYGGLLAEKCQACEDESAGSAEGISKV